MLDIKELKEKIKDFLTDSFTYLSSDSDESIQKKKRNVILAAVSLVLLVVVVFSVMAMSLRAGSSPANISTEKDVVYVRVAPGMSSDRIGQLLVDKGVISSKAKFWLATKINGADSRFRPGVFVMTSNMSVGDAMSILLNANSSVVRVTIPEGYNLREIAQRLEESGLVDSTEFLQVARNYAPYSYMEKKQDADYRAEGFLFPDTYEFSNDSSPEDIMKRMVDEFDSKLTPEVRQKMKERNLTIHEMVTLASLVEKEALFKDDMPIIAQVFYKRLKINMPLQTDTTITYLIGAKEDVSIADTKVNSPYNTYQNYGLPPGPIASPGMDAINAVLNPANTDYLYFVADRQGHNYYSNSYAEHMGNVNRVR